MEFREEAVELIESVDFQERTAIVIDDYHLLSSEDIDHFFERLSWAGIPGLHIVIVSRSVFGENTVELSLKGYCLVLARKHFELSSDEITEYCQLCGIRLKADEAAFLENYTEGWISAVYLCILGYQQSGKLEQLAASLYELIDRVVYQPCSEEIKEFLLTMCIFDSFTVGQAGYMWPKGNAANLLDQLTSKNTFIFFDCTQQAYYPHNILTGYLRRVLDQQSLERRQVLWKMAGEWYFKTGDYNHAMDYFYKAADFENLMYTIEMAKGTVFAKQPKAARIKYFQECPEQVRRRHILAGLSYAFNLFISAEMQLLVQQLHDVEDYINTVPKPDEDSRRRLTGELEVLKGITAYNNLHDMAEHFQAAWELLHGPSAFIDTKAPWTLGSPSVLYLYHRQSGKLEEEVQVIAELPCYYRLSGGHGSGGEYVMAAERYYNLGDFDNAEITAHKAFHFAKSRRQFSVVLCAAFLLMRLALCRGDWDYVADSLRKARDIIKQRALYLHIRILDLCEGFIFSCLNQPRRIPAWIAAGEAPDTLNFPSHGFYYIIWAKYLLLIGEYRQLAGVAGQLVAQDSIFPNLLAEIYIYIVEAAALDKLWRREEALASLEKALDIAMPDKIIMPFAENGGYISDMLQELQAAGRYQDFIGRILKFSPILAKTWHNISKKFVSNEKHILTARETEIAGLVAEGLSNQAIGKALNIETDTVKKALHKIFLKLSISNRAALTKFVIKQKIG